MIEMNKFVSNVTILAEQDFTHYMTEISLNKSGDQGSLRKRSDFNRCVVYIKPFTLRIWRTTTQTAAPTGSIRNGTRHRVVPPVGGNGVDPGGLPKNSKKVDERGRMQRFMIEQGHPLCSIFG